MSTDNNEVNLIKTIMDEDKNNTSVSQISSKEVCDLNNENNKNVKIAMDVSKSSLDIDKEVINIENPKLSSEKCDNQNDCEGNNDDLTKSDGKLVNCDKLIQTREKYETDTDTESRVSEKETSDSCDDFTSKRPKFSPETKIIEKAINKRLIHKVNELDLGVHSNLDNNKSKSTVILKKETDSLMKLLAYDSSDDDENDSDIEKNWQLRNLPSSFSDSESDSEESSDSSDSEVNNIKDVDLSGDVFGQDKGAIKKNPQKQTKQSQSEFEYLPPLPDLSKLKIDVSKEEFLHMGHVQAIIDKLVTIEALPGTPAYNLDSYLFIDHQTTKKPLGVIEDVIGPVSAPIYCVRFNSAKDIEESNVKTGIKVYSAPKSEYTQYVFVKELMKLKGTDASWLDDQELPDDIEELSDDEVFIQESDRLPGVHKRPQKRKHGSLERHRKFEQSMNRSNVLNSRVADMTNANQLSPQRNDMQNEFYRFPNVFPAPFDATVPPPSLGGYRQMGPPPRWPPRASHLAPRALAFPRPPKGWFANGSNGSGRGWGGYPGPSAQ